jgi:hypothetical protein
MFIHRMSKIHLANIFIWGGGGFCVVKGCLNKIVLVFLNIGDKLPEFNLSVVIEVRLILKGEMIYVLCGR